ncbi:MAG: diguanylate cyclase, partial [Desulfobulbaceae bacterium]|nr:diguanylate cyclase [Desulfobulbaceae bacterium]
NKLLAELTITDDLTKVGNHRYFSGCLDKEWRRLFRDAEPLSVIFVALDRFQEFNELLGRKKGEQCLQLVAQILQIPLRRTTDLLCRYGDSLFAILLPKTPLTGAQTVSRLIKQSIEELQITYHDGNTLSVSQGVATVTPSIEIAMDTLITMAHDALTTAQKAGGNQIVCAAPNNHPD